jgi:hypothetical protein
VKLMLHLRIRDGDAQRPDVEQHGSAVLTMPLDARIDDEKTQSWARWYQVIVLDSRTRATNEQPPRRRSTRFREDGRLNDRNTGTSVDVSLRFSRFHRPVL